MLYSLSPRCKLNLRLNSRKLPRRAACNFSAFPVLRASLIAHPFPAAFLASIRSQAAFPRVVGRFGFFVSWRNKSKIQTDQPHSRAQLTRPAGLRYGEGRFSTVVSLGG